MEFAKRHRQKITEMYCEKGFSSYKIAEELGTYSTKILRALDYLGIERRSYGEAQKQALESGRSAHPTKGKELSDAHKQSIGKKRSEQWKSLSKAERDKISKLNAERWANMSEAEKKKMQKLALNAVREAGRTGSKTEKFVKNYLEENGFQVEYHKTDMTENKLEIDLFLPELNIAIEIDGPSHFLPIWGEEKLRKQQAADVKKQGMILSRGYAIIRVRQVRKTLSLTRMIELSKAILQEVNSIQECFPKEGSRLIQIEVNDDRTTKYS